MTSDFAIAAFDRFTAELHASVSSLPGVVGLVVTGSAADRSRLDEWSDHDFIVVTSPAATEAVRSRLDWLPRFGSLVFCAPVAGEGYRAVYDDGHVLEFDVAPLEEIRGWQANDYSVLLDRGGVDEVMAAIAAKRKPHVSIDAEREIGQFLALILIGVGRARRGETLIAGAAVRNAAVAHLVNAWRERLPAAAPRHADNLDNWRRFELVYPESGPEIARAVAQEVEPAARALLDIAERRIAPGWASWPDLAVAAVRRRLGW
jgi:hypothetical protein